MVLRTFKEIRLSEGQAYLTVMDESALGSLALEELDDLDDGNDQEAQCKSDSVLSKTNGNEAEGVGQEGNFQQQSGQGGDTGGDEFEQMERLSQLTGWPIPSNLAGLRELEELHTGVIPKEQMLPYVLGDA